MQYIEDIFGEDELRTIPIKNLVSVLELELTRNPWEFSRGAKTQRLYKNALNELIIRVYYEYVYTNDLREIADYSEYVEFYNKEGAVFLTLDVPNSLNSKNIKEVNRAIRQGRYDYMESATEDLLKFAPYVPEPFKSDFIELGTNGIDLILAHYKNQITDYIKSPRYILDWENAVLNETDPTILDKLSKWTRPPDALFPQGLTAKTALIHQMTGVVI